MLTFKMTSLKYFDDISVKFYQIITKLIFLESTWKGLLKNVKDGTSRCFGGRKFNKTKVETILWDTRISFQLAFEPRAN